MASVENQFFVDASTQPEEWLDFDQFLDLEPSYSDDYSASANSISPDMALPYDTDMFTNDLPDLTQSGFPEMNYDLPQDGFFANQSTSFETLNDPPPVFDDAMYTGYQSYDSSYDFRQLVEAQAASDPRVASIKEKRREAAIALHLQRLCDATALDLDMSSDSNTSFSSPCWSDYMRESISPQPASSSPEQAPSALPSGNGGMEIVLDMNMNATTNLPKKQKPRSQAQKENYIKARKYGACEKHKKQHKRCNCLEKAAALAGVTEVPMDISYKERVKQPNPRMPVPSPRTSNVPGHVPDTQLGVRPSASVIKRIANNSSMNDSLVNPTIARPTAQPFTKTTAKSTRGSPGREPQFSTSFVLSPNPDSSKKTSDCPGHVPSSNVPRSPTDTNRKNVGLPTYRGCSLGKSSANRSVDSVTRHLATSSMQVKQTISVASNADQSDTGVTYAQRVPGTSIRRPRTLHVPTTLVSAAGTNVKQTPPGSTKAGISSRSRGLDVSQTRTSPLSSTVKVRSPVDMSNMKISSKENSPLELRSLLPRVVGVIDRSVPQGLRQSLESIAKSLDRSLQDRHSGTPKNSIARQETSKDCYVRNERGAQPTTSALLQVFSVCMRSLRSMAASWQLSLSRSYWPQWSEQLVLPSLSAFLSGSTLMSASKRLSMLK